MAGKILHVQDELTNNPERVTVETQYGPVFGGKANNGSTVFLEIPYALPPNRFEDPLPLPGGFRYSQKEYIWEANYCAQPNNDGQAAEMPFEDKVGLGSPTENPLFLNIFIPPSFPERRDFPVRVYIHGGFLQFGSPHTLGSQAQYIAAERSEIWVNIGYRLSVFGFLASETHKLKGNYGFKDQWLALEWIKQNISCFGGNMDDIQVTGLSAGAHSVHQLLHRVSTLPDGVPAPFSSAVLQSNAILTDPKTPSELEPQFIALCRALSLDPRSPFTVQTLKDRNKVPWSAITKVIESEQLGKYGTFRGCLSDDWMITSPGPMERQRNGSFTRSLKEHGVQYIILGEVLEEWYLYSIAHSIFSPSDFAPNLERYFSPAVVNKLLRAYPQPDGETEAELVKRFGDVLSYAQVYLPVRVLARDLRASEFPFLRYEICWTPEEVRPHGYVTHGTDRPLWAFRLPSLTDQEAETARCWLDTVVEQMRELQKGAKKAPLDYVLRLSKDTIGWGVDGKWELGMALASRLQ